MSKTPRMTVSRVSLSKLMLDPKNARGHPEKNLKAIADSLRQFGQQKPIVVNKEGVIVAGNGTAMAARTLGWEEIDVVVTDLVGREAAAFGLADNRAAELAIWDEDVLEELLKELQAAGEGLNLGWDENELSALASTLYPPVDPLPSPPVTPPPSEPKSKGRECPECGHKW